MEIENEIKYRISASKIGPILADTNIPSGAKLVLFGLIYRLGGKNFAFPSQKTIAKNIGLSERQVRIHLKTLKDKQVITWTRGVLNPFTEKMANVNRYDLSNILHQKTLTIRK